MADTSLTFDEMTFDQHEESFWKILHHSREIANIMSKPEFKNTHFYHGDEVAAFTMDNGTTEPLLYTALKCRNYDIRREALRRIDRKPNRQGIYDSRMISSIASRIIKIEGFNRDNRSVPSDSRVRNVAITWPEDPRASVEVSFQQFSNGSWQKIKETVSLDVEEREKLPV